MENSESYEKMRQRMTSEPVIEECKRAGVAWIPLMGDWFVGWSPRNLSPNPEGPWDHWVRLAVRVLQHPLTAQVDPELYQLANEHLDTEKAEQAASLNGQDIFELLTGLEASGD